MREVRLRGRAPCVVDQVRGADHQCRCGCPCRRAGSSWQIGCDWCRCRRSARRARAWCGRTRWRPSPSSRRTSSAWRRRACRPGRATGRRCLPIASVNSFGCCLAWSASCTSNCSRQHVDGGARQRQPEAFGDQRERSAPPATARIRRAQLRPAGDARPAPDRAPTASGWRRRHMRPSPRRIGHQRGCGRIDQRVAGCGGSMLPAARSASRAASSARAARRRNGC